ncbi:MAG TPA: hypothetical protein VF510_22410 [Ktedonobacterales bacterium]
MNFLENILGGGGQQQQDIQNFVQRFEQGPITEGYSDQEALDRYGQVAAPLPPQQYQQAAYQAFNRMSPEERSQFGQYLQQQAQQQGVPFPGQGGNYTDPNYLSQITTQVHQQPGLLRQLLGGSASGGSPMGGAGRLLSNPLAKAALAGIAAMAVKNFTQQRH